MPEERRNSASPPTRQISRRSLTSCHVTKSNPLAVVVPKVALSAVVGSTTASSISLIPRMHYLTFGIFRWAMRK
ncbi:unnamed protein product [Clonostachys rosea]|uniref:Uncharacterized protein n=1 Tax=Bionectria ochroleuca TaxID=29856 RepID=A0ABY6U2K4_BIOOC|nr:unnamed protein product [Clonostachys rosea]